MIDYSMRRSLVPMEKRFNLKVCVLFIVAGLLGLAALIMSLYSVSTANWSLIESFRVGLFQTCSPEQCRKNQYADDAPNANGTSPTFPRRYFNAGPLSVVSILVQIVGCFHCFVSSFLHLPCRWPSTSYIAPFLLLIAFVFQFCTLIEASAGVLLNGASARLCQGATVLLVGTLTLTAIGADRIYHLASVEYV